jgi:hypothetical protein
MCLFGSEELQDLRDRNVKAKKQNAKCENGKLPITLENMGSAVLSPATTQPGISPVVQATNAPVCPGVEETPRPGPSPDVQATNAPVCPGMEKTALDTDDFVIRCLMELKHRIPATGVDLKKLHTTQKKSEASTGEWSVGEIKDAQGTLCCVAAEASGNGAGVAQGAPAEKQFSVWATKVNVDDTDAVKTILKKAHTNGEINVNSMRRLQSLHLFLLECKNDDLITFVTHHTSDSPLACILGWSKILVKQLLAFNLRCRDLVEKDKSGCWKHANGKGDRVLKNPTFSVYELFRKIGVKPHLRGPACDDPGKTDFVYHREWHFRDDDSFRKARKRLCKGYNYCPDKGHRQRKREFKKRSEQGAV